MNTFTKHEINEAEACRTPNAHQLEETKSITKEDARFMQMAIDLSIENVEKGGGPFGAVIVRDGEIIATGVNSVVASNDPTAHAEVNAIRNACKAVGSFKLEGCVVYSSCEPCPMCLSALYWAGVSRICFGNTKEDAKNIDFDDSFIYDEIERDYKKRAIKFDHFMRDKSIVAFHNWSQKEDKIKY